MTFLETLWQSQLRMEAEARRDAVRIIGRSSTITDSQQRVTITVGPESQLRWPRRRRASKYWPEGISNL